jgi:hypothetical protein
MLCFLAGAGFDRLVTGAAGRIKFAAAALAGLTTIALLIACTVGFDAFFETYPRTAFYGNVNLAAGPIEPGLPRLLDVLKPAIVWTWLVRSTFASIGICACLGYAAVSFIPSRRFAPVFLLVLGADVVSFQLEMVRMDTATLSEQGLAALSFQPTPYWSRRHYAGPSEQKARLADVPLPRLAAVPDPRGQWGEQYWSLDSFTHLDQAGSILRVDHWLSPFDSFLRAFGPSETNESSTPPPGFMPYRGLWFPGNPRALERAGVTLDKVQFHRVARWLPDERAVAVALAHWQDDGLYIVGSGPPAPARIGPTRIDLDYEVTEFSANVVRILVRDVPEGGVWMSYADVWHPYWEATVNGIAARIRRADLAYKAVRLRSGTNDVVFTFSNPLLTASIRAMQVLAVGFAATVLAYLLGLVRDETAFLPSQPTHDT